jgi:hypothetical protein
MAGTAEMTVIGMGTMRDRSLTPQHGLALESLRLGEFQTLRLYSVRLPIRQY